MANAMFVVNEDGFIKRDGNSQKLIIEEHPVWKARNALAHGKDEWIYGGEKGHTFRDFKNVKASEEKLEEFQKVVRAYLSPYGPEITDRIVNRGTEGLRINITKETLNYG